MLLLYLCLKQSCVSVWVCACANILVRINKNKVDVVNNFELRGCRITYSESSLSNQCNRLERAQIDRILRVAVQYWVWRTVALLYGWAAPVRRGCTPWGRARRGPLFSSTGARSAIQLKRWEGLELSPSIKCKVGSCPLASLLTWSMHIEKEMPVVCYTMQSDTHIQYYPVTICVCAQADDTSNYLIKHQSHYAMFWKITSITLILVT